MAVHIHRRDFIAALTSAAGWPIAAHAQPPRLPVIGVLDTATGGAFSGRVASVKKGLAEIGFIEGRNVAVMARSAEGDDSKLSELAQEYVRRNVSVIVALGLPMSLAAKSATATIPIVFETGDDPIGAGLVAAFNRPEGNVTGISLLSPELATKRLALLRQLVSGVDAVGILVNTTNPSNERQLRELQAAAQSISLSLHIARARNEAEINVAFTTFIQRKIGAILIGSDPVFFSQRGQLVALAHRHAIPTSYPDREFVQAGGLISYAANRADGLIQTGVYAGRILKGEKPANLPVLLPTKFELVINLTTAKVHGWEIPPQLLAIADEVVE